MLFSVAGINYPTMTSIQKKCATCGEQKDAITDFQKQKSTCKACTKQRYDARRQAELQSDQPKTCIHCEKTGPATDFLSLKNICKECDLKKKKERSEKYKTEHQDKTCSHCGEKKGLEEFKTGLFICKVCCNEMEQKRRSQWTEERRAEENKKGREYYHQLAQQPPVLDRSTLEEEKQCTVCLQRQPVEQFYEHKKKGTIRSACKECTKEIKKQYYEENKEKYILQTNAYKKNKIKTDPIFHLERRMRCRVYSALKNNSATKEKRVLEYLGCTADFFQQWMAFQLYDGMTLENYGEVWHVDHTKPIASFDLTKENEQHACFSWKNCRPFLAQKNIQKSDSYHPFESVLQELKAHAFLTSHPATVK